MSGKESLKESVDLIKIKTSNLMEGNGHNFMLKDDIWGRGALILRSGVYLTEEIINKLLRFGVRRVYITVDDAEKYHDINKEQNHLMKKFVNTQGVLIIDKNLINASLLIKQLIEIGFKEGNIFVTKEPGTINSYFRAKQINFLFIDENLYDICKKCIEKYSLLKNIHTFIMLDKKDISMYKKTGISRIKFLPKPVSETELTGMVTEALESNFLNFWHAEEELIS